MFAVPCFAAKVGVKVNKTVNDGYAVTTPVNIDMQAQLPFLPKAFLETGMVFTAPRGEFVSSMKSLNHSHFDARIGGEITILGGQLRASTGAVNWFAGNNEGIPEGVVMDNEFSFLYEF